MKISPKLWVSFVAFLLMNVSLISQNIEGIVIDKESKTHLSFVQIGIIGKNIGTLSDENGRFKLNAKKVSESDSIVISSLGYSTKYFTLAALQNSLPIIELAKEVYELPKIDLIAKPLTQKNKLGYAKTNSTKKSTGWSFSPNWSQTIDKPMGERGTLIKLKGKPNFIKNVNFHIANNEYDSILCRIHIYDVKDGFPNQEITKENIFIKTSKKRGWVKVPIDHLELIVEDDVIVTIEWLEAWKEAPISGEGLHFSVGFFGKLFWRDYLHQPNWEGNKVHRMGIYLDTKTH